MEVVIEEPNYKVIVRHGPPNNKYDHAEQGTICKVVDRKGFYDLYKQKSPDDANPEWVRL